jgi:hypothetical protein
MTAGTRTEWDQHVSEEGGRGRRFEWVKASGRLANTRGCDDGDAVGHSGSAGDGNARTDSAGERGPTTLDHCTFFFVLARLRLRTCNFVSFMV